jgi:predicted secreted Zn-dependent protease
MHPRIVQISVLAGLGALAGGCEDPPLAPGSDQTASAAAAVASLGAPSALVATATAPGQVDLAWKDNSTTETGFEVHRSTDGANGTFTVPAGTGPNVTRYRDAELASQKQYCYKVRSYRTSGKKTTYTGFSNTACTTTIAVGPRAPINVYVRPMFSFGAVVGWADNADNEDGYRVERSTGRSGPWEAVVTRGPMNGLHSQEATDWGLAPEVEVCYRVVAFNSTGASASEIRCTVPVAAPTNLVAKAVDNQSIELTWADNSAFEDGYEVLTVRPVPGLVFKLPANATSYRHTGLVGNETYEYQVRAINDGGSSNASEPARASLSLQPPLAPTDVRVLPGSSTAAVVFWTDRSSNDDGFHIQRSTDGGLSWEFAVEGDNYASMYGASDGNRTPEREVCYRVIAWNVAGESAPSSSACTIPPAGPTNMVLTQIDSHTFELHWSDNSQVEEGYEVYAFGTEGDWLMLASLPPNATSARYDTSGVPPNYSGPGLVAINDGGMSDWGQ